MSERYSVEPGRKFLMNGQALVFKRHTADADEPYWFEDEQGHPRLFSHRELCDARENGDFIDWTAPSPAIVSDNERIFRARKTLDSANEAERREVERRLAFMNPWLERPELPRSARGLGPLIEAVHATRRAEADIEKRFEPPPPSVRTVQTWIHKYLEAGRNANSQVPQVRLRGNYRQRLAYKVNDIVWRKIDEVYLVRNGQCVAGLHREVTEAIERQNRLSPGAPLIAPSCEAVRRLVKGLCQYTVAFCREGERTAAERFRATGSGLVTERANEVWEIDDTRADLICLHADRKTVIGRPWLTVIIDVHTRMIMALVLSFSPPDTETALEAMRVAMKRKDAIVAKEDGLLGDWPARGRPDVIHCDNGKQYNSAAFKRAITSLGIQHRTLPLLKPWWKGTIERVIGTVMREVFHVVPGTTHANIFLRDRETPPETIAESTLGDAQRELLRWVVNTYQRRHHRGIATTPYKMWNASIREHPLRLPPADGDIDAALSITAARKIRKGGIELDGLRYITPHGLRLEMAPGSGSQREVIVRRDPGDLTVIWFLDSGVSDRSKEAWHEARLCTTDRPRVAGRTLAEYRLARQIRAADRDLADSDGSDWADTYDVMLADIERKAASDKLGPRVAAADQREKIVRQTKSLENERNSNPPADAAYLEERFMEEVPEPTPPPVPDADSETYSRDSFRMGARRLDPEEG